MRTISRSFVLFNIVLLFFGGCETLQLIGREHREKMTFLVQHAKEDQEAAKEQFRSALEEFSSLINFQGGDLQTKYEQLQYQYEQSQERAKQVHTRIEQIENVAGKLFEEWEGELELYQNRELRNSSQRKLVDTQAKYRDFINAMKRAEQKMQPVLDMFQDQVLFLKHNLNASAISSMEGTVVTLQSDVSELVRELERSIAEANQFINTMGLR
ncbi:MAG: DUF2959 family protein [bacterium]|jgi:uncharacterized protein YukE